MFDSPVISLSRDPRQPRLRRACEAAEPVAATCIDPAERWVLRRRANRPAPPSGRLPAVARGG